MVKVRSYESQDGLGLSIAHLVVSVLFVPSVGTEMPVVEGGAFLPHNT
jgi:hypothetical protein